MSKPNKCGEPVEPWRLEILKWLAEPPSYSLGVQCGGYSAPLPNMGNLVRGGKDFCSERCVSLALL